MGLPFAVTGILKEVIGAAAPELAIAIGASVDSLITVFTVVFAAMALVGTAFQIMNALGHFQGIYFGVGYHWVSLWFTGFWIPIPILNANPNYKKIFKIFNFSHLNLPHMLDVPIGANPL